MADQVVLQMQHIMKIYSNGVVANEDVKGTGAPAAADAVATVEGEA